MKELLASVAGIVVILFALNFLSYRVLGAAIRRKRKWDLNICCGITDGGGVNADIFQHTEVPNFVMLNDIYHLPFRDGEFDHTLCSHTIEHVDDPARFYEELRRVSKEVTLVLPPLWDPGAVLNIFEHRWIYLTWRKEHHTLPRFIKLPFATTLQTKFGQRIHA